MSRLNSRAVAAGVLSRVLSHQGSLNTQLEKTRSHPDYPLIQEMCFGVCRHYYPLRASVDSLLDKPLRAKDLDLHCLLLIGLYQVSHLRVPDHAAVNETVAASRSLKKPWAKGLVNAVLRKSLKQRQLTSEPSTDDEINYSHPAWLVNQLRNDWPEFWQQILAANNDRPPMTLRVNLGAISRDSYLEKLGSAGKSGKPGSLAESAVYLSEPCPVGDLPGFESGEVSIQDEASQLVPSLMQLGPDMRVLDACAAPGGKSCHILESKHSHLELLALDRNPRRLADVENNLERLKLHATIKTADASQPDEWWGKQPFQRILLDAPCSATGIIRRHPDVKLLRQEADIANYSDAQLSLLSSLWSCLANDGLLLYCTCSVLKQENDSTIERFLNQQQDAKYQAITADWGVQCRYGRQLLPDSSASDGFYFALLQKNGAVSA